MPHGICRPAEQARQSLSSLSKLSLEDFRNVEQSANAARNAQKAKYQGMLSLYLNVIYQIIKNMVYINSRYVLAFAKYEHDASLLLDGWVYDRYKTVFSDLIGYNPETMVCAMEYTNDKGEVKSCLVKLNL